VHRARDFYQTVLQVPFSAGHPGARRTDQSNPPLGIVPWQAAEKEHAYGRTQR
jgi:hypothetical protein